MRGLSQLSAQLVSLEVFFAYCLESKAELQAARVRHLNPTFRMRVQPNSRMLLARLVVMLLLLSAPSVLGFMTTARTAKRQQSRPCISRQQRNNNLFPIYALTERQLQFWEDVDSGLDDIANFFDKKGQSIDRIRQFAKSAQGLQPPPTPSAPGHEPSEEHVEGLTAQPFWDVTAQPDLFPWAAALEENAHIIQQEFNDKLSQQQPSENNNKNIFSSDSVWQNSVMGQGWAAIRLQRLGVWNTENCQEFPQTYELLRRLKIPLAVRGVCFAQQAPGTGVQPHSDGRNFILTSHLGLQVPDDCWIQVGEEQRGWQPGKLTTLDTSFTHSTGNPSASESRHVLILDFWHPELTEAERSALEFVYDLRNKFESGLVPFRQPRSVEPEGEGLAGLWKSLTGN